MHTPLDAGKVEGDEEQQMDLLYSRYACLTHISYFIIIIYLKLGHNSMFSFCQFPLIIWYKASLGVSDVLVKNDQIHPEKA
ncbi:MAG: hypothetical protein WA667_18410, partial [Candidatus Nitrosopolaris sp.]